MAEIIPYTAVISPGKTRSVQTKKDGEIVVVLPFLNTTHRNAIERYLQKLSAATYNSSAAITSDTTHFSDVVTAINALA